MKYKEIFRLKEMLEKATIPFKFKHVFRNGYQIVYPNDTFICSVIEHDFSYGSDEDLLEIMGLLTNEERKFDSVKGWLTAENVFERIKKHYEEVK